MGSKWTRILSGGVCAGLVFNVGGLTSAWLMDLAEGFARFGVQPTASAGLLHLGLRFGLGFASVLLYAGLQSGLGPGAATAMRAAILVWFIGYVPGSAVLNELGVFGDGQLALVLLWGAVEAGAAVVLGAWLHDRPASRS